MKKNNCLLSLVLALLLTFSLAACGTAPEPTEIPTEAPTEAPAAFFTEPVTVENPVVFLRLRLGGSSEQEQTITVYDNADGTMQITLIKDVGKRGTLDAALLHNLTAVLHETELETLSKQSAEYTDDPAVSSMFIEFADGSEWNALYRADAPQEFKDGYRHIEDFTAKLMADIPVYVPRIDIREGTDEAAAAAMEEIMNGTGIKELESFYVSNVPMNEYFGLSMGLSSAEGILNGVMCCHLDHHANYGIYIATLEEGTDAEAVARDFEVSLDWDRYVCVHPDYALIARKDNMVLCFNAGSNWYTETADAIKTAGWTVFREMERPTEP